MDKMYNTDSFFSKKPLANEPWDVVILGSGPAGLTAAIYTTRGAASTVILAGEAWGGQLMLTTTVDNFPGAPGIQGPLLMQKMRDHALSFGAELVEKSVVDVNFNPKPGSFFEVKTSEKSYFAKSVILSTGADTKWLGIPGEDKLRGRGVSSCAPCDAPFFKEKNVIVVGGGDSAMEEALVLTKYARHVTIVHRGDAFRASAAMQNRVFEAQTQGKITIIYNTEVLEFVGNTKLQLAKVRDIKTNKESEIVTDGAFVAIGHVPSTSALVGKIDLDSKGYIKKSSEEYHTATNVNGIFTAGDVHDYHYKQAITAAGFGCMAGMDALKYLDKNLPTW